MNLFIGCSSRNEIPKIYFESCGSYLNDIFSKDNNLVFGADKGGLMGLTYDIAKKNNKKIIGITPSMFKDAVDDMDIDELIFTSNISERTLKVIEKSDALIFLPGGIGSIYEFFSTLEFVRSHEFNKPIVIYNVNNFYDNLLLMLDKIYKEKFADNKLFYHISDDSKDTLEYINNFYI